MERELDTLPTSDRQRRTKDQGAFEENEREKRSKADSKASAEDRAGDDDGKQTVDNSDEDKEDWNSGSDKSTQA